MSFGIALLLSIQKGNISKLKYRDH